MFLYNVHAPNKTFAVQYQEGQNFKSLLDRIATKSGLSTAEQTALKGRKEGAGIVYEFEGERWSLEDDDDLAILHSRLPPNSSTGATLHLNPPSLHAHFASASSPAPPAYSTASTTIKSKAQANHPKTKASTTQEKPPPSVPTLSVNGGAGPLPQSRKVSKAHSDIANHEASAGETADGTKISKARSVMSTRSRRSKWGDDNAEPLGDVHKRKWLEFHANNGVRTVVGKVGDVDNVRMLLKSGYKQVYISRSFAIKAGLVPAKFGMGSFGYTGLKTLGNVPITVGSRTGHHQALISEEQHFDVILGRQWLERMAVKIDPLDQTALTYMDSGEVIPCDLVVLKDAQGNVITVT